MITDYASLQTDVISTLARSDIAAYVPDMIQRGEGRLRNDVRIRSNTCRGTFTITQDGDTLPSDYGELDAWYHDGTSYKGRIEIVNLAELAMVKRRLGDTGMPRYAAIADVTSGNRLYYGPSPSQSYVTYMSYRRLLTALSDTNTTNWLLLDSPHIYLYATLAESAPWLKNDARLPMWEAQLERRIQDFFMTQNRKQYSGHVHARPRRAIGG